MAETQTLNFGPEWLRALSGGGGGGSSSSSNVVASPPLSPVLPKYKLADYRYGREEMLALYVKDNKIPIDLHDKEFLPILQEEPLPPLALVPFTEEEQRNFSMSVNSAAVLRLTGRGGGPVAIAPRGRSTSRGRGRGRGDGGFYQRSFDDVDGGFGRGGREMHRSQSWEERGDRRFEKPGRKDPVDVVPGHFQLNHIRANYEEGGAALPRKHDFTRSESENWRRACREEQNGEDDEGGWRPAGARRDGDRRCPPSPDGPRSAGWRPEIHPGEQQQRRRFPFDAREDERGFRRPRSGSGSFEDERDSLPEWCLEDAEEETGTFDSSGAFLSLKKAPKEPILEEAELDFRPLEECEEALEEEDGEPRDTKETEAEDWREADRKEDAGRVEEEAPPAPPPAPEPHAPTAPPSRSEEPERPPPERKERPLPAPEPRPDPSKPPLHVPVSNSSMLEPLPVTITNSYTEVSAPSPSVQQPKPLEVPMAMPAMPAMPIPNPLSFSAGIMAPIGRPSAMPHHTDEDERLKHFEQEAEKMVAYLQEGDDRLAAKNLERPKPAGLALTHEAALKWFYKDPQGEIQGPFSNPEMSEWFQAGYFTMTLLVKRGCDEVFQALGEVMKMWGRVPFAPGPAPPPLQGDGDQERLKRQQELTALNLYQLQQLQYQYLLRQQYAQAMAQQKAAVLSSAPLQQQQQQQQQINLLLQQYQALKMRTSENILPPVTRSVSVPDSSGSVWEMQQNPSTQAPCAPSLQQQAAPPNTWEGSSVWDLPIDSVALAPTIEQMQQMEKSKATKSELERREAELRAKREEEEQRKRLEEEELARHKQEEALRRQREQQEEAQRRQKEEEERLAQEEALRRLEERRREEEERRQREELLRKQEEERRKQQEELEALRRRQEEEKRAAEEEAAVAAARLQQQQEEQKRREQQQQEAQRLQEAQRQQQEVQKLQEAQRQLQLQEAQRQQQEAQKLQEAQRQRQQQQEALRRLQQQQQQQQLAQMKLPSTSKWGQQQSAAAVALPQSPPSALSLCEIQKLEEERERQACEEQRRQQQELLKLQQQQALLAQQQPQAKLPGWGGVAKQPAATKSLLEIQREEAQQMKQRKEQPAAAQAAHPTVTQTNRPQNRAPTLSSSVWGAVNTGGSNWGSDASSIWGDAHNSNMGFWDEAVKEAALPQPQAPPPAKKGNAQKNNKGNANLSNSVSSRANKKAEEEEKLLKLFQGVNKGRQDGFMQWCEQTLHTLNTANNLDVPTFASFLKEVDSPYEVHDYVRAYLGDTPEAKEFAKQFLDRRAKQNANQQKQPSQNQQSQQSLKQQQDSVWGGTGSSSPYQSNHTSVQQPRFETVTSGKKKKKQKMVRADPSLLGFSVNAASERLNMGEIETVEDF